MSGAKNCPETPRQKMIGMMYLVLTAMLALNVSAEILNGFTKIRHSMESSISSTSKRTDDVMAMFKEAYEKDEASQKKYGEWYEIAQAIEAKSNEFYNYLEDFKLDVYNLVEGTTYEVGQISLDTVTLKGGSDTNKPHQYAEEIDEKSGRPHAEEMAFRINEYRQYMTSAESPCVVAKMSNPKFQHDWDQKVAMFESLFNTNDSYSTQEHKMVSWVETVFHEMPADAVVAMITKYQNDVRMAENDMINFMWQQTSTSTFVANKVEALAIPTNGEYIMQGQHYRARIASAMIDTNQVPRVFINGREIEGGIYDVVATGAGEQRLSGYMLVGDDTTQYKFEAKYTVGVPSAVVSNTLLTVVYRNYNNPFSISVPGVASSKVQVKTSGAPASVTRDGDLFIIKPDKSAKEGSTMDLEVLAEVDGKVSSMGVMKYRVMKLDDPKSYVLAGGQECDDEVGKAALVNGSATVVAGYPKSSLIQADWQVKSFEVKFPNGERVSCTGNKFSADAIKKLNQCRPGQSVIIRNIKAVGPDGAHPANNLALTLK